MKRIVLLILFCSTALAVIHPPLPLVSSKRASVASFSPSDVSGLQVWLDVNGLSGSDGDTKQTFPDVSGNAHDFSHATAGSRPVFTNSTPSMGNAKTLWFDGADQYTNRTYATAAQNYTIFTVFKMDAALNNFVDCVFFNTDGSGSMILYGQLLSQGGVSIWDGGAFRNFAYVSDANPRVFSFVLNSTGTSLNVYTNGISSGAATAWAQPAAGEYFSMFGFGASLFTKGIAGDQLIYSGALGTTDRQNIEDYLGTKFGIPINH